ncbi:MAG: hypothetical protein ACI81T_001800 [Bacteroidia bacterium]
MQEGLQENLQLTQKVLSLKAKECKAWLVYFNQIYFKMKKLFSILSVALFVCMVSTSSVAAPEPEPWIYDASAKKLIDDGDRSTLWVCSDGAGCTAYSLE